MADEALACFTSLLDTVPGWIEDLGSILKAAEETQKELLSTHQPAEPTPPPSIGMRRKSKSSSLKSGRSKGEANGAHQLDVLRPQLKHLTNSDALRLSQRKRKTPSALSADQTNPCKYRTRAAAVVYYDGDTQKRFEKLVRAVGSSRNAIRKGKMSAKVDALSRNGSSSSDANSSDGGEGDDQPQLNHKLGYQPQRPTRLPAFFRSDNSEAFDRVDSQLEKAQVLCERSAHQILRDGDCSVEVSNAREHFSQALEMARLELPALKKRAEKAAERRRRSEERQRLEDETEEQRKISVSRLSQQIATVVAAAYPNEGILEADELEVDDASDDGEEDFNISAMQFSKFSQLRSSRLAAH